MKGEQGDQQPFPRMAEGREAVREVDKEVVRLAECGLPVARLLITPPGRKRVAERIRRGGHTAHQPPRVRDGQERHHQRRRCLDAGRTATITVKGNNLPAANGSTGTGFYLKQYHLINRWHIEQYAYLLRKLRDMKEGSGNVLDNSMVLFCSALSDGNKHDPRKKVWLRFQVHEDRLEIRVRDEGSGFDLDRVADPLAAGNLLKVSGRGIFLIRAFMDEFRVAKIPGSGTEVTLVKRLNSKMQHA